VLAQRLRTKQKKPVVGFQICLAPVSKQQHQLEEVDDDDDEEVVEGKVF
jgi:hypothetical protein